MIAPKPLKKMQALLARWFRMQPSEIDQLTVPELLDWVDQANEQIKNEYGKK